MTRTWALIGGVVLVSILLPASVHARQYTVRMQTKNALTTHWDVGFVILPDGTRKDGEIQIKVVKGVDTVEVRWRADGKSKDKIVYTREQIQRFGLREDLVTDFKQSKDPLRNFQPGYIVLTDGRRIDGMIGNSGGWVVQMARLANADNTVSEFTGSQAQLFMQTIDGKEHVFESYRGMFFERFADGPLILIRNPNPTTRASGFLTSLAEMARDSLAKQAAEAQFKQEMEKADPKNLSDGVRQANESARNAARTAGEISSINVGGYEEEYLVRGRDLPQSRYVVITSNNFDRYMSSLTTRCAAYGALEKKEQKRLLRWSAIVESMQWFNDNCN